MTRNAHLVEWIGVLTLGLLAIYFLSISWRKWPDPLIDFGRELYIPWRLSEGAVLYRDVPGSFGPLSQSFHGLLFRCFGPGMMVLVISNLIVFGAILFLLYRLCRRAWGATAAFASAAVFIAVFGFSQLTGISNYNYATPYAHETTHGLLVTLALLSVLANWIVRPTLATSLLAGLLAGMSLLLKPEFMLSVTVLVAVALTLRWRYFALPKLSGIALMLSGSFIPSAVSFLYFLRYFPARQAFAWTGHAWVPFLIIPPKASAAPGAGPPLANIQTSFSGLNDTTSNLSQHILATLIACFLVAAIVGIVLAARKVTRFYLRMIIALACFAGLAAFSYLVVNWMEVGKCFLGLLLLYLVAHGLFRIARQPMTNDIAGEVRRVLLAVLGISLMTRMALHGRIYHYGFCQAAIAGSVLPALLVGEMPMWLRAAKRDRYLLIALMGALLLPGIARITGYSGSLLKTKTAPIGEGRDRFYAFSRRMEPTGEMVGAVVKYLEKIEKKESLLVLPEGLIINYLVRTPLALPYLAMLASSPELTHELDEKPPQYVVLISRDLREYGVERYGDKAGQGKETIAWLSQHYRQVGHLGGNPLDVKQRGAVLLEYVSSPAVQ